MRVLVVGTVPPPGGPVAQALGKIAADRVAAGDEVEVLSPDLRSAAHQNARLRGLWLIVALLRQARRFDALILRIESDLPLRKDAGRISRAATLLALGATLRLYGDVTLRLDSPIPLPGGLGGRSASELWANTARVVVANEDDAKNLRSVPGIAEDQVIVEPVHASERQEHFDGWDVDLTRNLRDEVMVLIRERAARDRRALAASVSKTDSSVLFGDSPLDANRATNPNIRGLAQFVAARAFRVAKRVMATAKS